MSEIEHIPNRDVLLPADVPNEGLILHASYEGVDNVGVGDPLGADSCAG